MVVEEDMAQRGQVGLHLGGHGGIVEAAEAVRDDQHLRFRQAEHEAQLALAEDDHQRVADGAELQAGEVQHREFPPVRQLERHHVAGPDAALAQRQGDACGERIELTIGDAPLLPGFAAPGDDGRALRRGRHRAGEVVAQGCRAPMAGGAGGGAAGGEALLLWGHSCSPCARRLSAWRIAPRPCRRVRARRSAS
jgi:hypothetical protein